MAQCQSCGAIQKPLDVTWRAECAPVYDSYNSYVVSAGVEQSVRGEAYTGSRFTPRSDIALEGLVARGELASKGSLLDYGCGQGPTSRAAFRLLPN